MSLDSSCNHTVSSSQCVCLLGNPEFYISVMVCWIRQAQKLQTVDPCLRSKIFEYSGLRNSFGMFLDDFVDEFVKQKHCTEEKCN